MKNVSYSDARQRLAELWDQVLDEREAVTLTRRGKESIVMVPAEEYEGLLETAHLLRSPANAARLLAALERARSGAGQPKDVSELRAELARAQEA